LRLAELRTSLIFSVGVNFEEDDDVYYDAYYDIFCIWRIGYSRFIPAQQKATISHYHVLMLYLYLLSPYTMLFAVSVERTSLTPRYSALAL
jgi:hypothetical protein